MANDNASYDLGKSYAHKYENNADAGKVDKEVHDLLLNDFHKGMHSKVDMDQVKKGLVDESKHIPGLHLVDDGGLNIKRQYEPIPGVPLKLDGGNLFNISEAMTKHNQLEAQEAAAAAKKDQPAPLAQADVFGIHLEIPNPWDGLNFMTGQKK